MIPMLYETVEDVPRIASKDYHTLYDKPLVPDDSNEWLGMTFRGTGVRIDDHPCKNRLHMRGCGECSSNNVMVIYAQWSVSPHSGDSYWDYEVVCDDCGKFTARSFNEND